MILCATNGGTLPEFVEQTVKMVSQKTKCKIGIHTHNDAELAVANALAAVNAGATQIQGTINGYGERCGNANLISLIPTLQIKLGYDIVGSDKLCQLTELARTVVVSELSGS